MNTMSPAQVMANRNKRLHQDEIAARDAALLAKPKVAYSTWTGKPSRVENEEN